MFKAPLIFSMLTFSMLMAGITSPAQADEPSHYINIVTFQADAPNFEYESIFNGNLGQLITSIEAHTHVILATRTSKLQHRDIINLQTDVLRMTKQGNLASGGLDCRFIFNDESDEDSAFFSISGICDRLVANDTGTDRKKTIIKRKMLSDPSPVFNVWLKLYEDPTTGIAFYADID